MNRISFTTANFVAREIGYKMTKGWGEGATATNTCFRPLETFAERFGAMLDEVRRMGFASIELWSAHLAVEWATDEHLKLAREALDARGIRVAAYAGGVPIDDEGMALCARLMKAVDTRMIASLCDPIHLTDGRDRFVAYLRYHDFLFAYENHPEQSARLLLEHVRPDPDENIGITLDTGWSGTQGWDAVEGLRELSTAVVNVHLKDIRTPDYTGGPTLKHNGHDTCALGEGIMRIEDIIAELKRVGYRGNITIEHEPEDYNPTEEVIRSLVLVNRELPKPIEVFNHAPVRTVIVGCGNIASKYADQVQAYPLVDLVGFCDLDAGRARDFAARYGGTAYASLEDLLNDESVELVINLTIHHAHVEVITACLNAGKHVHTEKPLAMSHAEARKLADVAEAKGVRLSSAPSTFLGEAAQTAKRIIDSGELGTLRLLYGEVNHGRIESWHPAPEPFYRVGPVWDVAVYPIGIWAALCGPVREVTAHGAILKKDRRTLSGEPYELETLDFAVAWLRFDSGVVARLTANFYVGPTKQRSAIEFHGDEKTLALGSWFISDAPVEVAPFGGAFARRPNIRTGYSGIEFARGVDDLTRAIREGREHRCNAEMACHVVEVMEAIHRSVTERKTIAVTSSYPLPAPLL